MKVFSYLKVCLLAFILSLSILQQAFGQEKHMAVTVVTENWYPHNYYDENKQIVGSSTEFVKQVLDDANIDYQINLYPWQRAYHLAKNQENVLIYTMLRSPEREPFFHWFCPISRSITHSFYKLATRKDIQINDDSDLTNYSINVTRGTFPHELLKSDVIAKGLNLQLSATNDTRLALLLTKRVDLIVEADGVIQSTLKYQGYPENTIEKVHTFKPEFQSINCMGLNKKSDQQLVDAITTAYQHLASKIQQ